MLRPRIPVVLATLLLLFAGDAFAMRQRPVRHPGWSELDVAPRDVWSAAEPESVRVTHVSLDLTVDFVAQQLRGAATLTLANRMGTRTLVLDTWDLTITRVRRDGADASWRYRPVTNGNRPLEIDITPETQRVTIDYSTSRTAQGLYWNTAAQSYGRQKPYLYSLNEPIDARTWIPVQDTPTVRVTYDATLRVPPGMLALMSADGNAREANESGVYRFDMPTPIPAYLIALAVGRLEFRELDERTGVYAEPELIDDAEWELQYVPAMVDAAETVAGRFPFTRHDVLLMPPTFVVGGMEHPMLNFINPFSVVSGNRPAQPDPKNLIAHELAHSWAGDSATLASWDDVWLNEGITSYLALRILELMHGRERTDLQFFLDRQSYANFATQVQDKSATIMHRVVPYPDYGFSSTSYVKGELFIKTLEDRIGREAFDVFLRKYFETFAYRWVDHRNFLALLRATTTFDEPAMRLDEWIYQPGLPANVTAPTSSTIFSRAQSRASAFTSGTAIADLAPSTWSDVETELFLQLTPALGSRMAEVDAALGLSLRTAPPATWLLAAGYANYAPAMPAIERVLMRGGPNGTITTLYRALASTSSGRARAIDIFGRARDRYHDAIENSVRQILGLASSGLADVA